MGERYPDIESAEMIVDETYETSHEFEEFDVIVTTNLFGDILSTYAGLVGSGIFRALYWRRRGYF